MSEDWISKMEAKVKAEHEALYGAYKNKIEALEAERDELKLTLIAAQQNLKHRREEWKAWKKELEAVKAREVELVAYALSRAANEWSNGLTKAESYQIAKDMISAYVYDTTNGPLFVRVEEERKK